MKAPLTMAALGFSALAFFITIALFPSNVHARDNPYLELQNVTAAPGMVKVSAGFYADGDSITELTGSFTAPAGAVMVGLILDPALKWRSETSLSPDGTILNFRVYGGMVRLYGLAHVFDLQLDAAVPGGKITGTVSAKRDHASNPWLGVAIRGGNLTIAGDTIPIFLYNLTQPPEVVKYGISLAAITAQMPQVVISNSTGQVYAGPANQVPGLPQGGYTFTLRLKNSLPVTVTGPVASAVNMGTVYLGDVNQDGTINILDWSAALDHYQQPSPYDVTMDGMIDLLDLAFIKANFNQGS